jgi:hypothetical protein
MVLSRAQGRMAALCLSRQLPLELVQLILSFVAPTLLNIGRELEILSKWAHDASYENVPSIDVLENPNNASRIDNVLHVFQEQFCNHALDILRLNTYEAHVFGRCKLAWILFEVRRLVLHRQQGIKKFLNYQFRMINAHVYPYVEVPLNERSGSTRAHEELPYAMTEYLHSINEIEHIWQQWFRCEPSDVYPFEESLTWLVAIQLAQEFQHFPLDKVPCDHPFEFLANPTCGRCQPIEIWAH